MALWRLVDLRIVLHAYVLGSSDAVGRNLAWKGNILLQCASTREQKLEYQTRRLGDTVSEIHNKYVCIAIRIRARVCSGYTSDYEGRETFISKVTEIPELFDWKDWMGP